MKILVLVLFLTTWTSYGSHHYFPPLMAHSYNVKTDIEKNSINSNNEKTVEEVAKAYLKIFYDLNYESLEQYYTDESYWYDPTTALIFPNAQKSVGKEKIIADLRLGFSGVFDASYSIENAFYSGPYVGIWGTYSYKIPARYFQGLQDEDAIFEFNIPMMTNLVIKDGKVLEHLEYADWNLWTKQAQENAKKIQKR